MRFIITVIIAIAAIILFNTLLANLPFHNSILYGLFAGFVILRLYQNIHSNYLIRNKSTHNGEIISFEKKDINEVAEINYVADVKFTSPYDSKEYKIKSHLNAKPTDTFVYININKKNPLKSKVIEKTTSIENLSLASAAIAFCYLFIKNL